MDNECPISFKQKWIPKSTCSNHETNSMDINPADITTQQTFYVNSQGVVHHNAEIITVDESNVQDHTICNKDNNLSIEKDISPSDSNALNVETVQTSSKEPAVAIAASPSTVCVVSDSPLKTSMAATIAKGHNAHVSETPHIHNIEEGPSMSIRTLDPNAVTSSAKASIISSSSEIYSTRELLNHTIPASNNSNSQISDLTTVVLNTFQVQKGMIDSKVDESSLSQSCINPTYPSNDKPPNILPTNLTSINPEFEKEIADMRSKNSHDTRKNKGIFDSVTPTIRTRSQANSSK